MQTLLTIFTVVSGTLTTVAAVLALYFAHRTIRQARAAQREAHVWRQEDAAERRTVQAVEEAARAATLAELRSLHDRIVEARDAQLAEQATARAGDARQQRLATLGRITDVLVGLADVAWGEANDPPTPAELALPPTRLHLMRANLVAALASYAALGGEEIAGTAALLGELDMYMGGSPPHKFVGLAKFALEGVARAAARDA